MALIQKWPSLVFLGYIKQENIFCFLLEGKNAFLDYKNKKFKKSKNCGFFQKLNTWFWSKIGHFLSSFFKEI